MNCDELRENLIELAYDELDEPGRQAALEHLLGCASCRDEYARLRRGRALWHLLQNRPTDVSGMRRAPRHNEESVAPAPGSGASVGGPSGGGSPQLGQWFHCALPSASPLSQRTAQTGQRQ